MLEERGLAPRKALGQNFLIDKNLITKLIDAAKVHPGDLVLEIGPGTGTLTEAMLSRGCTVIACELDHGLAAMLVERAPSIPNGANLRVIEGDCLDGRALNPAVAQALGDCPFSLVANLPYNAATPLMMALLLNHPRCDKLAVTIQKEVVDRLVANPGSKDYGTLGILCQALAKVTSIAKLPKECFWPQPDVTSAMVLLERLPIPRTADGAALATFCQSLFSKRRKQLGAILGRAVPWPAGIRPEQRPEELTIEQFELLRLAAAGHPGSSGEPPARPDMDQR